MRTIGFAGTAKNTGKTTTAAHLLGLAQAHGLRTALTSIGFDGENRDNVTGLPKPRYTLQPGTWIATAENCLARGSARIQRVETTPVETILGKVVIAEITEPGTVLLAGPNRRADLAVILEHLAAFGIDTTLVDGALNRMAPLAITDGLVLSTGAAFDDSIAFIARHSAALARIFSLPFSALPITEKIHIVWTDGTIHLLEHGSLLNRESVSVLQKHFTSSPSVHIHSLTIPDACNPALLSDLLESHPQVFETSRLILGSPLKMVVSASPLDWNPLLDRCADLDCLVSVLETVPVKLMTVNPFYPRYIPQTWSYEPAYLDKQALLAEVSSQVTAFPVIDIRQSPLPDLYSIVWNG